MGCLLRDELFFALNLPEPDFVSPVGGPVRGS